MTARRRASPAAFLIATVLVAACAAGDPDAQAGAAHGVMLDVDRADSLDALADAAAREHGAPGENEAVQLRQRSAGAGSAETAAAGSRALGFRDVVIE